MKKVSLTKFIKDNERMIFVLGIFLALLPLSFDTIKDLNPTCAGVLAITISLAIFLILKNFSLSGEEEMSVEAYLFVGCLWFIAITVASLTFQIQTQESLSFLDIIFRIICFVFGIILSINLLKKIEEKIEKRKIIKFFTNLFLLLLPFLLLFDNIILFFKNGSEYIMLFFMGVYAILLARAIFLGADYMFSGIGYFIQELFYEKFLLKSLRNLKKKYYNPQNRKRNNFKLV